MNKEKLLSVESLSIKQNGGSTLVNSVSLDIENGKCLGITGESGSGKSLTCKAILGLLPTKTFAVSGSITFCGQNLHALDIRAMNAIRGKDIAIVMQNPMTAFNPAFKLGEQIIETIRAHLPVKKQEAFEMAICQLEKMKLPRVRDLMNSYPHTLSGGMLQRTMIAIALMMSPKLIIADEATTALDISTQAVILAEFQKIRELGIAMLVVSHDFGVVAQLADDLIVMKNGNVVERGITRDVLLHPQTAYTQELLDASILERKIG